MRVRGTGMEGCETVGGTGKEGERAAGRGKVKGKAGRDETAQTR